MQNDIGSGGAGSGIDPVGLDKLSSRVREEVDRGELPSCQFAVAHRGRVVLEQTFGAPPSSRYVIFSCTKAITAAAVWLLFDRGLLEPETRVADHIAEFAGNGKAAVTVGHLLTHTSGFPHATMDPDEWADPATRRARFSRWELETTPGEHFQYHGTSASWVLADLIETIDGRDFRDFARAEVLDSLGLPGLTLGTTTERHVQPEPEQLLAVGQPPEPATAAAVGIDVAAIGSDQASLLLHNDPAFRGIGQPGGGAVGRATDLAMFYQGLLHADAGPWSSAALLAGTREIACTLPDPMTGVPANRTLGLIVAGGDGNAMMRGFGRATSARAFGHMGAGGQIGWADPETGLSMAYLTNGLDRDPVRMGIRSDAVSTLAARTASAPPSRVAR